MRETVVLGIGTNKAFGTLSGEFLLECACRALSRVLGEMKKSSIYKTKPMYVEDQSDFFNMVVSGNFDGSADELLSEIHRIEADFGRNRAQEIRFGERTLDIDIEIFGAQKIKSETLEIPHPRILERAFVLAPLAELLKSGQLSLVDSEKYLDALSKIGDSGVKKIGTAL